MKNAEFTGFYRIYVSCQAVLRDQLALNEDTPLWVWAIFQVAQNCDFCIVGVIEKSSIMVNS
jgi:hypothetical protein